MTEIVSQIARISPLISSPPQKIRYGALAFVDVLVICQPNGQLGPLLVWILKFFLGNSQKTNNQQFTIDPITIFFFILDCQSCYDLLPYYTSICVPEKS